MSTLRKPDQLSFIFANHNRDYDRWPRTAGTTAGTEAGTAVAWLAARSTAGAFNDRGLLRLGGTAPAAKPACSDVRGARPYPWRKFAVESCPLDQPEHAPVEANQVSREEHIRVTVEIAGWPAECAERLIDAGLGPCEVARLFADAMRRIQ